MSDHMTNQLRAWSPGQAMLPPDPGGHNRALDRVAAEHLREVAPGLAPDASGYPFLSDERPPAPAPPAEATNPVKTLSALLVAGGAKLVTRLTAAQACDVVREIARQNGHDVVIEAPAPGATGEEPCACAGHREPGDPLICRKRYSEMLEAIYEDDYGDTAELRDALLRHDLALRARAREAEERAERVVSDRDSWRRTCEKLTRERDEAREQRDRVLADIQTALHMSTAPGSPDIVEAMKWETDHHRHETERRSKLVADLAAERAARLRAEAERDAALTEANDLRLRVERLVEGAAKLTERAEEAEEEVRLSDFRVRSAETRADGLLAKVAAAEAEVKRLRLAWDDPEMDATDGARPAWWRGNDAGVAGVVRIVNEALDEPLPLAGCVGGADLERVRQRIAALRERAERLVEIGDRMAASIGADWPALTRAWAAAKVQP